MASSATYCPSCPGTSRLSSAPRPRGSHDRRGRRHRRGDGTGRTHGGHRHTGRLFFRDVRVISDWRIRVDGHRPHHLTVLSQDACSTTLVSLMRLDSA
ncbi:glycogen debranching N-terminal domain-containing protein [Streptomyces sp. NRRL B-3648]|uniref:glycogen debranching N-terminal domain-containing protein n=1 Tax=Streptomyces sp. NRRL B-3648 TaxID=1519493 RepID=UPI000D149683